ncbi:MAG: hypothetical protein ACREX3_07395 [Gammaproteobacteria bacterium]
MYVAAKRFLKRRGWTLLAGQPPSGCDHLPVVEVKSTTREGIGSRGAYKPDLIAHGANVFLLIECKPAHDEGDAAKLREILGDPGRVSTLFEELRQRYVFDRHEITADIEHFRRGLRGALAHSGEPIRQPDLLVITLENVDGSGKAFPPTFPDQLLDAALELG